MSSNNISCILFMANVKKMYRGNIFCVTQTFLTHADIGGYTTNIDVRDKLFLYDFLQGCFAQFGIVKKCWIRVNVRQNSLANDLTTGVDLMCWDSVILRSLTPSWLTLRSLWSSAPQDSWTQCRGHRVCSVLGGPSNTTVSYTLHLSASCIWKCPMIS